MFLVKSFLCGVLRKSRQLLNTMNISLNIFSEKKNKKNKFILEEKELVLDEDCIQTLTKELLNI